MLVDSSFMSAATQTGPSEKVSISVSEVQVGKIIVAYEPQIRPLCLFLTR